MVSIPLTCGSSVAERRDLMVATYSLVCGTGASVTATVCTGMACIPAPARLRRLLLAARGRKPHQNKTTNPMNAFQRDLPHSIFPLFRFIQPEHRKAPEGLSCRIAELFRLPHLPILRTTPAGEYAASREKV